MKKHLLALSAAAVFLAPQTVGAEGFSINEWSAEGFAMGGARMFAEDDAANFAYNPASMTKIQGEKAKISVAYIAPHGKYEVTELNQVGSAATAFGGASMEGRNRVNPAYAPGTYYVKQLNEKEWIGFGAYSRFGNMCQFEAGSLPGTNNTSAKLNGISLGVNYAKKLDSKWAASLGAEINYVGLQYDKTPYMGPNLGWHHVHLEGESYALGWNAAANYAFDDKNEIGVVYRSKVKHSMEADMDSTLFPGVIDAYGVVTLPESWMLGYGHKFNDKTRMELNATWTRWSRLDKLNIYNSVNPMLTDRNWSDGWRYAIGIEHKLSDKYTLLAGIAHDERGIPDEGADFMVPTGERDTYTIGLQYHDKKQTIAASFGYMDVGDLNMKCHSDTDAYAKARMHDSYTKIIVLSYQYNF